MFNVNLCLDELFIQMFEKIVSSEEENSNFKCISVDSQLSKSQRLRNRRGSSQHRSVNIKSLQNGKIK